MFQRYVTEFGLRCSEGLVFIAIGGVMGWISHGAMSGVDAVGGGSIPPSISEQIVEPTPGEWSIVEGSVYDGDTFRVSNGHQEKKIRLCGIDAPEMSQTGGQASRDHLRSQLTGRMRLYEIEQDRYGRTIAEVFMVQPNGEVFINGEMLISGHAWLYTTYVNGCPNAIALQNASELGSAKLSGLPPWEYRKRQ